MNIKHKTSHFKSVTHVFGHYCNLYFRLHNTICFSLSLFILMGLTSCMPPRGEEGYWKNTGRFWEATWQSTNKEEGQGNRGWGNEASGGYVEEGYGEDYATGFSISSTKENYEDGYSSSSAEDSYKNRLSSSSTEEEDYSDEPESVVATDLDEAKKAVWMIRNSKGIFSGTGFFISPTLLVTNSHVVDAAETYGRGTIDQGYLTKRNSTEEIEIESLLALTAYPDLALLETKTPSPFYLEIRDTPIRSDEKIFIPGYPASRNGLLVFKESTGTIKEGTTTWIQDNFRDNAGGSSGSPVLDSSAYVVGVNFAGGSSGRSVFANRDELKRFLRENRDYPCEHISYKECLAIAQEDLVDTADDTNNFRAQHFLGRLYYFGDMGFRKNAEKARHWFGVARKNWNASQRNN